MEEPSLIAEYLDALASELRFDPPLCRRVRAEVEDHLCESVAADPAGASGEAARRAIERFGPPRDLAGQFAVASLARQAKAGGILVMLIVLGTFAAMKGRVMWWGPSQTVQSPELVTTAITVMRGVFWLAVVIGLAGWAYSARAKVPSSLGSVGRRWLRRCLILCAVATAAVVAMVTLDAMLVAFRLMASAWSAAHVIPLLFIGTELTLAAILIVHLLDVMHRTSATSALLRH